MDKNLERFLKSINYTDNLDTLTSAKVSKVLYIKKEDLYEVYIENDQILPLDIVLSLIDKSKKGINGTDKCYIKFKYNKLDKDIIVEYLNYLFTNLKNKKASLVSLNNDDLTIDDNNIIIDVSSKTEQDKLKQELNKLESHLKDFGIDGFNISVNLNE